MNNHMSAAQYRKEVTSKEKEPENPYSRDLDDMLFGSSRKMVQEEFKEGMSGSKINIPKIHSNIQQRHPCL
jgi:hypothetical protein